MLPDLDLPQETIPSASDSMLMQLLLALGLSALAGTEHEVLLEEQRHRSNSQQRGAYTGKSVRRHGVLRSNFDCNEAYPELNSCILPLSHAPCSSSPPTVQNVMTTNILEVLKFSFCTFLS
jgi:hypothetical protein